jgi:hypothetical protein
MKMKFALMALMAAGVMNAQQMSIQIDENPLPAVPGQNIAQALNHTRSKIARVQQEAAKTIADAQAKAARSAVTLAKIQEVETQLAAVENASSQSNMALKELARKKAQLARREAQVRSTQNALDKQYTSFQQQLQNLRLAV